MKPVEYITPAQYYKLNKVFRDKLSARVKIFCGTIIENDRKILLVKEGGEKQFNGFDFPGGKLMWGETLSECAKREVLEEAGYKIILTGLVGIYQRDIKLDEQDYLRIIFTGKVTKYVGVIKDTTVTERKWISIKNLTDSSIYRNEDVINEITDYIDKKIYPLDIISSFKW